MSKSAQHSANAPTDYSTQDESRLEEGYVQRKLYEQGAEIFREGESGEHAYLIERGQVEVSASRRGRRHVIATLGPGDLFGEMALLDRRVRSASATATAQTEVVAIGREQLQQKIKKTDPVLDLLLKVILHRFRSTLRRMLESENITPGVLSSTGGLQAIGEETRELAIAQIKVAEELRAALDNDQICTFYQPIIELQEGHVAGLEALVRWQHPARGLVPPSEFIKLAEDTGLIGLLGQQVLEHACHDLAHFQERFESAFPKLPRLFMSVNVSAQQLQDPAHMVKLAEILERSGIDPAQIKLEITEGLLIDNPQAAGTALEDLKKLGVTLAIDDFGTGYSSLSYLRRFPLDTLKIDRSFIDAMSKDRNSQKIVRAMSDLARTLGLDVVAEGIEDPDTIDVLREFGCTYAQGYLISEPVPASQALDLLAERIRW